jgi:protein-S-isoprenylcysteine O-methyltransferase Ste14
MNIAGISKYQKLFGVGPLGLAVSMALLGLVWLLDQALGPAQILSRPAPVRGIALVLFCVWACWHIWAIVTIKQWWTQDQLCMTGPYRLVRHPMYAGALLLANPALALMFNSWIVLLWPVLVCPAWSILAKREEVMMAGTFGEDYRTYAARTGRFIPRLHLSANH